MTVQSNVPLGVPKEYHKKYLERLSKINKGSDNAVLFAADQRFEHLNSSFLGKSIAADDTSPIHFFNIAEHSLVNLMATQFGLIDRYSKNFTKIDYVVKLNSLSKLSKDGYGYSQSKKLVSLKKIAKLANDAKLSIVAFGYTIYIGIENESDQMKEASSIIQQAHSLGFPVILWSYPKGNAVKNELDPTIINTACSIANCLGADIAKINAPQKKGFDTIALIEDAVKSAGNTKILISGGDAINSIDFLKNTYNIVNFTNALGVAVGRNIHQKPLHEAVQFCNALERIVNKREALNLVIEDFEVHRNISSIV